MEKGLQIIHFLSFPVIFNENLQIEMGHIAVHTSWSFLFLAEANKEGKKEKEKRRAATFLHKRDYRKQEFYV